MAESSERIGLEEDDEVVRNLTEPKMPSEKELEKHYLMAHIPYRNWCLVCARARGRQTQDSQEFEKELLFRE